jgi:hypothetical protein
MEQKAAKESDDFGDDSVFLQPDIHAQPREVPTKPNFSMRKSMSSRASVLNAVRRQSKSIVDIAYADQVAAIGHATDTAAKVRALVRLAQSAALKSVQKEAEDDEDEMSDLVDSVVARLRKNLGGNYIDPSLVENVASQIDKLQSSVSEKPATDGATGLRKKVLDYTKDLMAEADAWKTVMAEYNKEYKTARDYRKKLEGFKGDVLKADISQLPEDERRALDAVSDGTKQLSTLKKQRERLLLRQLEVCTELQKRRKTVDDLEANTTHMADRVRKICAELRCCDDEDVVVSLTKRALAETAETPFAVEVREWQKQVLNENE